MRTKTFHEDGILSVRPFNGESCNLVPFVQFKKREKHPWRSITFSKITLLKLTLLHGCFFTFFKSYKWHQTVQSITYDVTEYPRKLMSDISVV